MLKKRSLVRRVGCTIAIVVISCPVIVFMLANLMLWHQQWMRDKGSILFVEKADPEELLNACRVMMTNNVLIESGHRGVQVDKSYFTMMSSDGPWPEGVPSAIVGLDPDYLKVTKHYVEVNIGDGINMICLFAFPTNQVGMGSLRVVDGLWIVRRNQLLREREKLRRLVGEG